MRWNQELFKRALDFAARAHGGQQVPGSGFPYVVHVTKVATEVLHACHDSSFDIDLAMTCALLHDTVEDAGVMHAQLLETFGKDVADGVLALTKDDSVPKEERMRECLGRIHAQRKEVWMVKLADRITNLEPPPPAWSLEKRRAYLAEARTIRDALRGASTPLEVRLEEKLREYTTHCT